MEVDHPGPVLRARRNLQPASKQVTPVLSKKQKHVSASSVFVKKGLRAKKASLPCQPKIDTPKSAIHDASDSSSHSAHKDDRRASKKRSDMHPLAIEFRDTKDNYTNYLLESTSLQIKKTLDFLVSGLHESTLHTVSSDSDGSQDSPLRLSAPVQFNRAAHKVYLPISAYSVRLSRTNTDGEPEPLMCTLEKRMLDFEEHLEQQKAKIEKKRREWELIVGEIWKLGVQCLGEEAMDAMLFTDKPNRELSSSPSKATLAESTLFIPEHDASPALDKTRSKKRVKFVSPDVTDELPTATSASLEFLHGPSHWLVGPVSGMPNLPEQDIKQVDSRIKELGQKELEEYRKAERDYQAHWQKKTAQLLRVFED